MNQKQTDSTRAEFRMNIMIVYELCSERKLQLIGYFFHDRIIHV